jgi:hypothetical protein
MKYLPFNSIKFQQIQENHDLDQLVPSIYIYIKFTSRVIPQGETYFKSSYKYIDNSAFKTALGHVLLSHTSA